MSWRATSGRLLPWTGHAAVTASRRCRRTGPPVSGMRARNGSCWSWLMTMRCGRWPGHLMAPGGHDVRDRTARVWDAVNGKQLLILRGHSEAGWGVAWSPASDRIATSSNDNTTRIWDAASGAELLTLRGHEDHTERCAWSPDGTRIAHRVLGCDRADLGHLLRQPAHAAQRTRTAGPRGGLVTRRVAYRLCFQRRHDPYLGRRRGNGGAGTARS